jgi:hypothetical protein
MTPINRLCGNLINASSHDKIEDDLENESDYASSLAEPNLCKGCLKFQRCARDLAELPMPQEPMPQEPMPQEPIYKRIYIHKKFKSLTMCAYSCDLCRFLTREFWYFCGSCSDHRKDYPFRAHFESPDHEVQIFLTRDNDDMGVLLGWELYLGTLSGNMTSPIYTSNDWPTFKDNIRGKDLRFNEQFQCIRGWLVTRQADHQDCIVSTLRESRFLPKRLLDVGLVDKGRYVL